MNRIQWFYQNIAKRDLLYKFNTINIHQIPELQNVFLQVNTKNTLVDKTQILPLLTGLEMLSGQKMKKTYAKKSIAAFKLRKGHILGAAGTLRNEKMFYFLEKLFFVAFPKNKEFLKLQFPHSLEKRQTFHKNAEVISVKKTKYIKSAFTFSGNSFLLYPELENHYELFDAVKGFDVTLIIKTPEFTKQYPIKGTQILLSFFVP